MLVDVDKIFFAFVKRDMVYIKTFDEEMLTLPLRSLRQKLGHFPLHRSYIVNIEGEDTPVFNGTSILVMEDREERNTGRATSPRSSAGCSASGGV